MAQGLSSLLGGLAQGFTDLGKSTLDVLGGGTTNNVLTAGLDALINKKSYGQAVKDANQRQKDFRKWLYETESDKDAAAKGLGTALNGAQTAIDLIPGLGQSAPVNAIQGAIGGLADEFKFNGENYDWGKGAQRAAVGAGAGLAAGGLGKALANSGSKVLSNGVLKGAATGSLGGALSQAGGTAIEGGNADQILQSAAQGAQFGALLGAGTGGVQSLAGALKKTRAKNGAPAIMDEEVVMAELAPDENAARRQAQFDLLQRTNPMTDEYHTGIRTPEEIRTLKNIVDNYNEDNNFTYPDFTLADAQKALANGELPVYSSKPIEPGAFISPSKMMAQDYAGQGGQVYTKNIPLEDFAFIESGDEGNYLPLREEVMASRVAPGQLGLFDQTQTTTPKTATTQLGLFDQPTQPVAPKTIDVADVNPYAPVNGQVTDTMRDRAADIMTNYQNGLPENELYNRIDPETLPTSGIDVIARQADGLKPKARKEYITKALFGNKSIENATLDELFDVYYAGDPQRRASMEAKIQQVRDSKYYIPELKDTIIENTRKNFVKTVKTMVNKASEATNNRGGFTGAADAVLSERLGIAPGNTNKRQLRHDSDKTTYGRYRPDAKEISITEKVTNPENAISTMAHERLHSFQHEADAQGGRYTEDVKNAYKDLQKDLLPLLHSRSQIRKNHARNLDYYGSRIEQESRMLQDYLDQKGYTDSKRMGRGEYGDEINPAFDKFFDKLRELSKKGVALPAILAALGLGEYATENQEEDKDNGQQI